MRRYFLEIMMRKPRELRPRYSYHVAARINRGEMIFENNRHYKDLLIKYIKKAKMKYQFDVRNICIMGNHVHLQIKPLGESSLSSIMQYILGNFARIYNKINNYKGHVWYDRFKSKIIFTLKQYISTFIYIANNPVRAGICNSPLDYCHNGITALYMKNFVSDARTRKSMRTILELLDFPGKRVSNAIEAFLISFSFDKAKDANLEYGFYSKNDKKSR